MMQRLKEEMLEANLELVRRGLVLYTFGNASGIDRSEGLVVIKPSGVDYDRLTPEDMVVTDLEGVVIEGSLRPSSDLKTHLALYQAFDGIGAVVHTHSEHATAWAQAGRDIPALGTTHADYFHGSVPCTRELTDEEINGDYVLNTGKAIIERFSVHRSSGCTRRSGSGTRSICMGPCSAGCGAQRSGIGGNRQDGLYDSAYKPAKWCVRCAFRQALLPKARHELNLRAEVEG
jgi:L-ribulose-5-phosphate 4-epimerase